MHDVLGYRYSYFNRVTNSSGYFRMTGFATIRKIRDFERRAADVGLVIQEPAPLDRGYSATSSTYGSIWIDEVSADNICLVPMEGRYPSWGTRKTPIFTGTIEEGNIFLQGIEFAHVSDASINLTSQKKRLATEARVAERLRKQEEERRKKEEQKKVWDILKYSKQKEKEAEW